MKIRSRKDQLVITALDHEGMDALMSGNYERVCELCEAVCDQRGRELLDELVTERLPGDVVEEGGALWNTLWIGVSTENGGFIGAVHMLGRPTENRELNISLHAVEDFEDPAFARVFERVCERILCHRMVYYLRVDPVNEQEITFLKGYRFVLNQIDGFYEREKNRPAWVLICLFLGLASGLAVSSAFGNMALGVAVGAVGGSIIGLILDGADTTRRRPK